MVHRATNTLTEVDKKKHGKKRRLISQAFSDSALKSYENVVLTHVKQLCSELISTEGKAVTDGAWAPAKNMARWCKKISTRICSTHKIDSYIRRLLHV